MQSSYKFEILCLAESTIFNRNLNDAGWSIDINLVIIDLLQYNKLSGHWLVCFNPILLRQIVRKTVCITGKFSSSIFGPRLTIFVLLIDKAFWKWEKYSVTDSLENGLYNDDLWDWEFISSWKWPYPTSISVSVMHT